MLLAAVMQFTSACGTARIQHQLLDSMLTADLHNAIYAVSHAVTGCGLS